MNDKEVINWYNCFMSAGINVWIDGGWCVDALLGRQTREHPDMDIAIERKNNTSVRDILKSLDFEEEERGDSSEWNYVMKHSDGRKIDIHVFEFDENKNNIYGIEYPYESLQGKGTISGQKVSCISPEWMFKFKTSYEPIEKDIKDVQALASKFGYELPPKYRTP